MFHVSSLTSPGNNTQKRVTTIAKFSEILWHIMPCLQPWRVLQEWSNWLCCLTGDNILLWSYGLRSPTSIPCSSCLHALDKVCSALSSPRANGADRSYLQWPYGPGINHLLQRKKLASKQSPHNLQMINSQHTHFIAAQFHTFFKKMSSLLVVSMQAGSVARHDIIISKQWRGFYHLCCCALLIASVIMQTIQLAIHNEPATTNYITHTLYYGFNETSLSSILYSIKGL